MRQEEPARARACRFFAFSEAHRSSFVFDLAGLRMLESRQGLLRGCNVLTTIGHQDVRRLLAAGATIIDVLPDEEFANEHIAGAIHIPLRKIDRSVTTRFGKHDPVIVYCWDMQ